MDLKTKILNILRILALVVIFFMGVAAITGHPLITVSLCIIPVIIDMNLENQSKQKELGPKAAFYHEHFWDLMLAYTCLVCLVLGGLKLWDTYQNGAPDYYYEYKEQKTGKTGSAATSISDQESTSVDEESVSSDE